MVTSPLTRPGQAPRTMVPLATVRGQRAPREDGTILYRGVFQPCWKPITHPTLELESVRFPWSPSPILISPSELRLQAPDLSRDSATA
jgi:hypothetical protein